MTIFDHIENIKIQCEMILNELEKEKSAYDYWLEDTRSEQNDFIEDLYNKIDADKLYNKIKNKDNEAI